MYEINLITKDNNISIVDNRVDLNVTENTSVINISGQVTNEILFNEVENVINFNQTGIKGEPGDDNLFIQDTQPITTLDKYVWFQTDSGNLKTLWVETGA